MAKTIYITESQFSKLNEYLDKEVMYPLYKRMNSQYFHHDKGTMKYHLGSKPKVVKPTWLIHMTDIESAKEIVKNGFKNAVIPDAMDYVLGTGHENAIHGDNGYCFAYKASDVIDDYESNHCLGGGAAIGGYPFILFVAGGLEFYHETDEDWQVIFHNTDAKNRILIYLWNEPRNINDKSEFLYGVGNRNGEPLFSGSIEKVIDFCITNFRQYSKYLVGNVDIPVEDDERSDRRMEYQANRDYKPLPSDAVNKYDKWHSWEEEKDDYENWDNELEKMIYPRQEEILKAQGQSIDGLKNKTMEVFKIDENDPEFDSLFDLMLRGYHASRRDVVGELQKEHPFYIRRRPDGLYWRN